MTMPTILMPRAKAAAAEDFNSGGSTSSLGPNWDNFIEGGGTLGVSSSQAATTGSTDGRKSALHKTRMRSENMFVQATCSTAPNSSLRAGVIFRADEAFANWLALTVSSGSAILIQGAGLVGWQDANVTVLATWAGFANGNVIRVEAKDDVLEGFKNGVSLGTYSASRPYTLGPTLRRVGLQVGRGSFTNSGNLDNWSAGDL